MVEMSQAIPKTETAGASENSVYFYQTARRLVPEHSVCIVLLIICSRLLYILNID